MSTPSSILDAINQYSSFLQTSKPAEAPIWLVELSGGSIINTLSSEPDPVTSRFNYYYHARFNKLYAREWIINKPSQGLQIAIWVQISYGEVQRTISSIVTGAIESESASALVNFSADFNDDFG